MNSSKNRSPIPRLISSFGIVLALCLGTASALPCLAQSSPGLLIQSDLTKPVSQPAADGAPAVADLHPKEIPLNHDFGAEPGTLWTSTDEVSSTSLSTIASPSAMVIRARVPKPQEPDVVANPGRPAMATSALLTPVGHMQFENGVLYAARSAEFTDRAGMEETMRLTVARRLQFIVSAEPVAYSQTTHEDLTQRGDATGGLQVVAIEGHGAKPTIALSYLHLVHIGTATDLDIGGYANSVLLMGSLDLGRLHVDTNGFVNEMKGPVRRAQFGQATATTLPLRPKLTATIELRSFTQPLTGDYGLSTLFGAGYSLRPNLVFDAGVVRGLNSTSTRWQATGGVTYVLPRQTLVF